MLLEGGLFVKEPRGLNPFTPTRVVTGALLLWALVYLWGVRELDIGTIESPGAGAFPIVVGIALLLLSLAVLIRVSSSQEKWIIKTKDPLYLILGLIVASASLPYLGYLITMFCLIFFSLRVVEDTDWVPSLITSIILPSVSYYIFVYWLKIQLPKGILGIF
jgi:hypothetical protein